MLGDGLYTVAQIRRMEAAAASAGLDGARLMRRAGAAALVALRARWPRARVITVLAGGGHNGGDAWALAGAALAAGLRVELLTLASPEALPPAARQAAHAYIAAQGVWRGYVGDTNIAGDVIVDGLLGIGLSAAPRALYASAIAGINGAQAPCLALDVPSGIDADTGDAPGSAVRAALTVTFLAHKPGLATGKGLAHAGEVALAELGVWAPDAIVPVARRLTPAALAPLRPRRAPDAHKGMQGTVGLIGGNVGMPGAVILAATAAYRAGAGLVRCATHPAHAASLPCARPEVLAFPAGDGAALGASLAGCDVLAIGPGLGRDAWARDLFAAALAGERPAILDADALNLLADAPRRRDDWILTPHPGEAARLLSIDVAGVQRDRVAAARAIAARFGGVCVLKGAGTVITQGARAAICAFSVPALATAGTGDVLTGVIAALRAQGLTAFDAACLGVWLHARAGMRAAAQGDAGVLASDLFAPLREELNAAAL